MRQTLQSLSKTTPRDLYRLTVVLDGFDAETLKVLNGYGDLLDQTIISEKNEGLGPSLNKAFALVDSMRKWDGGYPLTTYVQDDVIFAQGWYEKLSSKYVQMFGALRLAFASGHSAVEHKEDPRAETHALGADMYTNKYIRATCMMAFNSVWMSMLPIPKIDPETGQERGRPHNGLGSGVDWHFVRVHPNSVVRKGMTNLIIPGLVVHNGYNKSTWLKKDLPELETDKALMPKRCTCSFDDSEEMTRHAPLCQLAGSW